MALLSVIQRWHFREGMPTQLNRISWTRALAACCSASRTCPVFRVGAGHPTFFGNINIFFGTQQAQDKDSAEGPKSLLNATDTLLHIWPDIQIDIAERLGISPNTDAWGAPSTTKHSRSQWTLRT